MTSIRSFASRLGASSRRADRRAQAGVVLAFVVAVFLTFARLGSLPLINPDEGRNAEVARELVQTGSWVVPTYNGLPYLDKPVFYFKAVALSFAAFGESEMAARLPSALFALGILVLLFLWCRKEYGGPSAALAVVTVAGIPLFFIQARYVIFDMALAFFVVAAVLAGYLAEASADRRRRRLWLVGAIAAGLAVLVKGPVGFIVPSLVLTVFFVVERQPRAILRLLAPGNLLAFTAVVTPWFVAVTLQHPDFPYYGIMEESLRRFSTSAFSRTGPIYYYLPVTLGVCFPWSVLFPESVVAAWRARARLSRADRLLITWSLVVILFFSLSQSKLPGYILTATIAIGVLTARVFALALANPKGQAAAIIRRGSTFLALASLVGAGLFAAELLSPGALERLFGINSREFNLMKPVFPAVLISMMGMAVVALAARTWRNVLLAFAAFILFPVSLLTVAFPGLLAYAEADSSKNLARVVGTVAPGTTVACLECFPTGLPFYLERNIIVISRTGRELTSNYIIFALAKSQRWPEEVVRFDERDRWLASRSDDVFLLAKGGRRASLDSIAVARGQSATELVPGWWGVVLRPAEALD